MPSTKVKYQRTANPRVNRKSDSAFALRTLDALENEEEHKAEVGEEKPHISLTDPKTLTHSNLLHLQSTHGNQAVQRLLAKSRQANGTGMPVQRLTSAATFQKNTKLTARKGKSHAFFDGIIEALRGYEGATGAQPSTKLALLNKIVEAATTWLSSPKSKKSSRKKYVTTLINELGDEINGIQNSLKDLKASSFKDSNATASQDQAVGGQMNKLDKVTYNFGIDVVDGVAKKIKGGTTETFFKENSDPDDNFQKTRAPYSGIKQDDARLANRNLAMYEVDKLLGGSLIPPTFKATHRGVEGIAMQKVEGHTGMYHKFGARDDNPMMRNDRSKDEKAEDLAAMQLPQVKQGLANLYMLDIICGQVDRHAGNYILEVVNGKIVGVKGIDNDLAFGKDYDDITYGTNPMIPAVAGEVVQALKGIDKAFAQRIIDLNANTGRLVTALTGLLDPAEITSTLSRLDSLAKFLQPLIANNDPRIKTEWK